MSITEQTEAFWKECLRHYKLGYYVILTGHRLDDFDMLKQLIEHFPSDQRSFDVTLRNRITVPLFEAHKDEIEALIDQKFNQ